MKSWRNTLKKKLTIKPDQKFDQVFWSKFENEFKVENKKVFFGFDFRFWTVIAAVLVVGASFYFKTSERNTVDLQVAQLIDNQDLLADFELIETLDDDLMLASNEEWGMLLE